MRFKHGEEIRYRALIAPFITHEKVQEMRNYIQHGRITTYEHVNSVTRLSFILNRRLKLGADEKALTTGAMLHDFYLYDWHKDADIIEGLHGYTHAKAALKNARLHFDINDKEAHIISSHMWPLNITCIPKSREAWIVTLADKIVSTKEVLFCR